MSDWLSVIKTLAPTVATAMLGPAAGMVVTGLGELFGMPDATTEKIQAVIESGQLTAEQISAIKQLDMRLKAEEQERGFRFEELAFKSQAGARDRDVEIVKATGRNWRADLMFALAVGMIGTLVYLIWKDPNINEYMKGVVTLVLGRFLGYLDNIYSFEFGTTRGSQNKDSTINALASK